ncbi:unnamed protein product [Pleuronectes platessa]|uniref:Uncharacterized protein n=1 Tax=Pleuronectes platessa TaxID=8262 RepID=A0A9N7UQN1_PLEPL|nr:unnamed protein product [Pleuronectes platessa]
MLQQATKSAASQSARGGLLLLEEAFSSSRRPSPPRGDLLLLEEAFSCSSSKSAPVQTVCWGGGDVTVSSFALGQSEAPSLPSPPTKTQRRTQLFEFSSLPPAAVRWFCVLTKFLHQRLFASSLLELIGEFVQIRI